jgi:anti-sigma regulatory factor (Ser/Thr protein kinase)
MNQEKDILIEDIVAALTRKIEDLQSHHKRLHTLQNLTVIGLSDTDLHTQMSSALDVILKEFAPLLRTRQSGAIFLWDRPRMELRLVAHRQFSPEHQRLCARLVPGQCLCGLAAQTREKFFTQCQDGRHTIRVSDSAPHGHCIIPILNGRRLLGVLNLYTEPDHLPTEEEKVQLDSIANLLSMLIKSEQGRALEMLQATRTWTLRQQVSAAQGLDMLEVSSKLARLLAKATPDYGRYVAALEELLVNAIEHGICGITCQEKTTLKGGVIGQEGCDFSRLDGQVWRDEVLRRLREHPDKAIEVAFTQSEQEIVITICDPGQGFDVERFRRQRQEMTMCPNGKGIGIAESIFDSITYNATGNAVTVTIRLDG